MKTAKGDHTPQDKEVFRTQIKELLDLRIIRPSNSRHRSTTFMVKKP